MKKVGTWWNNRDIDLVEIDGKVYALNENGWNGEAYYDCWECTGKYYMDASEEKYTIKPINEEVAEDEYEIIGYEVERS